MEIESQLLIHKLNAKSSFAFSFKSFMCILSPVCKYSIVMCKLCWIKIWMWIGVLQQSPQCGNLRHALTDPYYLGLFCKLKKTLSAGIGVPHLEVYFSKFQLANKVTFTCHLLKKVLSLRQNCLSLQNYLSLNELRMWFAKIQITKNEINQLWMWFATSQLLCLDFHQK